MKNRKKMIVTVAVLGALALFAGCTTASAVSLEEAKDLVQQKMGNENALVIEQETDREDGVYELEIIIDGVGYEFEVDSRTGEVREMEREDVRPAAETQPAETKPAETKSAEITLEEAKAIAYAHAGVKESEACDKSHERDDGIYEIDFEHGGWEYEYDISREGKILNVHKEPEPTAPPVQQQPAETQPAETKPAETKPAETKPNTITLEEAKAIAFAHAGVKESEAYDKSYERDDGIYEIDFEHGGWEYEYDISLEGKILRSHKEQEVPETKPAETKPREDKSDRISAEKALSIAMDHAGVSEVRDRDVEWDDGRWEVSFESAGTEYDYDISADGTILRWEKELDD